MTHIQVQVHKFFTDATGAKGLNNAILGWQEIQGYISPSITMNWMAIAQDNDIQYRGDIDMQNGFATGRYEIEGGVEGLADITLTAADGFGVLTGYNDEFDIGSISAQPHPGNILDLFYSHTDTQATDIQFDGDILSIVAGHVPVVNGTPMILTTDWFVALGKTGASSTTNYFPTPGSYTITWE